MRKPLSGLVLYHQRSIERARAVVQNCADVDEHDVLETEHRIAVRRRAVQREMACVEHSADFLRTARRWFGLASLCLDHCGGSSEERFVLGSGLPGAERFDARVAKQFGVAG